jgi:hypothetical protein
MLVTEQMIDVAARTGDMYRLQQWARHGVRVTTAEPLCSAAERGLLNAVLILVREFGADVSHVNLSATPLMLAAKEGHLDVVRYLVRAGADVNQVSHYCTALIIAAHRGHLAVVRCLLEFGAQVDAVDASGDTALLASAEEGHYLVMQCMLERGGAKNMDVVNLDGHTVWDKLTFFLEDLEGERGDPAALTALLRVMVLRGAPSPALLKLMSPESMNLVQEGIRLRARLPAYLAHRRAYLDSRCPRISVLPAVLRALIYGFEGPATTEELWATGLGVAP